MEIKNDGRLKICWMRIVGYQQFQDVFLDFTHPETGEPLDKICLIGANGTGKTVVLEMIFESIRKAIDGTTFKKQRSKQGCAIIKYQWGMKSYISLIGQSQPFVFEIGKPVSAKLEGIIAYTPFSFHEFEEELLSSNVRNELFSVPHFETVTGYLSTVDPRNLLVYMPSEGIHNSYSTLVNVPETNLDNAINHHLSDPSLAIISSDNVISFWNNLVFHVYQRLRTRMEFIGLPENRTRTIGSLDDEFDSIHPQILEQLNSIWEGILSKAGLELDFERVKIPLGLDDNLEAYIRLKGKDAIIPYSEISSGIRNYIFALGHLFSLYFNREISKGFLLVDEPENGLFPDFLYDLVDVYRQATIDKNGKNNTQMFFATHNPIIAAQFEPHERIILEWNDDGSVRTRRGVAPIGDDPNDVLRKDFAVASLMGKEGLEAWNRYLELKRLLKTDEEAAKKEDIATAYLELGRLYGFPA
jgi:hypothetical protein